MMNLASTLLVYAAILSISTYASAEKAAAQNTIGSGTHQVDVTLPAARSHPSLFLNQRELDDIRSQIQSNKQPLKRWYLAVDAGAGVSLGPLYNGTDIVQTKDMFRTKSQVPLHNALVYHIDEDFSAAQTARDMLLDFADNSLKAITEVNGQLDTSFVWFHRFTDPTSHNGSQNNTLGTENGALELALAFTHFAFAYDLIYESGALSAADKAKIEDYLQRGYILIRQGSRGFVEGQLQPPHNQSPHWANGGSVNACHRYANHTSAHIAALASIGFVLNRQDMINQSIVGGDVRVPHPWSELVEQSIYMSGDLVVGCDSGSPTPTHDGEIVDRYRMETNQGFAYSLVGYKNLLLVAEAARRKGIDLYNFQAVDGENLSLPAKYLAPIQNDFVDPAMLAAQTINYPGSESDGRDFYNGDTVRFQYFYNFDLLSQSFYADRVANKAFEGVKGLSDTEVAARRKFFDVVFFGKYYTPDHFKWDFHLDDIDAYWEADANIANFDVSGGVLSFESTNADPIVRNTRLNLKADDYHYVDVRMRLTKLNSSVPTSSVAQLFLANGDKSSVYAPVDAQWQTMRFPVMILPGWTGTIDQIRLDPTNRADVKVEIEYIEISK